MADPRPASDDHRDHDPLAVAAYVAGEADATALLGGRHAAACPTCRLLADDLRAVMAATAALHDATFSAPRDFRVRAEDARRITRSGRLARLFRPDRLQAFGGAVAGLGLAGLLVAAILPGGLLGPLSGGASASGDLRDTYGPAPTAVAAEMPSTVPLEAGSAAPVAPQPSQIASTETVEKSAADGSSPGPADLALVSGLAIVAGVGLVAVARLARRPAD